MRQSLNSDDGRRRVWCRSIVTLVAAATVAVGVSAAPLISGTVTARNGAPIAGVQVQAEISSTGTAAPTDDQGAFRFDAGVLFSSGELRNAPGLLLRLSKPGYQSVQLMVHLSPGETPAPVAAKLDASSGSAALAAADKQALDPFLAAPGTAPLYLVPYTLDGVVSPDPQSVNELLRANLERVIVTHLQTAVTGGPPVSLKLLPVQSSDSDRLRAYGSYLNALAMITGHGEIVPAGGGPGVLGVSSKFVVVPQADPLDAAVLYVDDDVPADRVASPRMYQVLSKLWGRSTVLAMGVSEFGKAKAAHDKVAMKRIRGYLQAERGGAGPGDELLIVQLNTLIEGVDQELAR